MITRQDKQAAEDFLLGGIEEPTPEQAAAPATPPVVTEPIPPLARMPAAPFSSLPWARSADCQSAVSQVANLQALTPQDQCTLIANSVRILREEICNHFPELAQHLTPTQASLSCFAILHEAEQLKDCLLSFQTKLALRRPR